jgi:tetratricopeptide (TPR) repeat protein
LAELYLGTQRFEDAIGAYREVLSNQRENVIALNNTALMLTTTNPAQARKQIEIAMQLVGPLPTIVDSYAMILLANGEKEQALTAARRVISEKPVLLDPELYPAMARQWGGYYFHLAAILDANGQTTEALEAMGEALRLGAEESDVFEPELPLWRRMLEKWNAANPNKSE